MPRGETPLISPHGSYRSTFFVSYDPPCTLPCLLFTPLCCLVCSRFRSRFPRHSPVLRIVLPFSRNVFRPDVRRLRPPSSPVMLLCVAPHHVPTLCLGNPPVTAPPPVHAQTPRPMSPLVQGKTHARWRLLRRVRKDPKDQLHWRRGRRRVPLHG